jgi:hypothetical protein
MTAHGANHAIPDPDLSQARWFRSSASGDSGNCVEVAITEHAVAIRDSKKPDGGHLLFTPAEWAAFLAGAKNGEFDL